MDPSPHQVPLGSKPALEWVEELQSEVIPCIQAELIAVAEERDQLLRTWEKEFPGVQPTAFTDIEARALAESAHGWQDWAQARTRQTLAAQRLNDVEVALRSHCEQGKGIPFWDLVGKLDAMGQHARLKVSLAQCTRKLGEAQTALREMTLRRGMEVTPERVEATARAYVSTSAAWVADMARVRARARELVNDLEEGRVLVRALQSFEQRPVRLRPSAEGGRVPVLDGSETFRLLKTIGRKTRK